MGGGGYSSVSLSVWFFSRAIQFLQKSLQISCLRTASSEQNNMRGRWLHLRGSAFSVWAFIESLFAVGPLPCLSLCLCTQLRKLFRSVSIKNKPAVLSWAWRRVVAWGYWMRQSSWKPHCPSATPTSIQSARCHVLSLSTCNRQESTREQSGKEALPSQSPQSKGKR